MISVTPSQAQFNKLRDKIRKSTKKGGQKSRKGKREVRKTKETLNGEPAANAGTQVSKANTSIKTGLKGIRKRMARPDWTTTSMSYIERTLERVRKNLDFLKSDPLESKKPYYKQHEKSYAEIAAKYKQGESNGKIADESKDYFGMQKYLATVFKAAIWYPQKNGGGEVPNK